ncbi:MAG: metallophosphoesterase [Defluviitaleaceae bacterium]|nr:metallophosphoesterase [Defluviitaleaceae bacterium]
MKILVLSDSHGVTRLMEDVVAKHANDVACVMFLGDCLEDCEKVASKFQDMAFHMVPGNCDYHSHLPDELLIKLGDKKIWICHGHNHNLRIGYDGIVSFATAKRADICLFGHTHVPVVFEKNGIVFLNPGSITEPRGTKRKSYAVVEILGNTVLPKIIEA